jgi:hypothetical protein
MSNAPVLMFGTQAAVISPRVDPERQLTVLAELFAEVVEVGVVLRDLEERMKAQDEWLNANRQHALWSTRANHAWIVRKEHERTLFTIHGIASDANRLTDKMDDTTKREARDCIHAWACLGGVAMYALAWNVVPNTIWLEGAITEGSTLKDVSVPF